MNMIKFKQGVWKNLTVMAGFGILSMLLSYIKFVIPGMEGGGSDMREIGVLLSILFLPNWIYMLGVSFIASLSFPFNDLEVSTILMHCTASLFAWFAYSFFKNKISDVYLLGGMWAIMVIVYYIVFLIPTLIVVFYLFKVINSNEIFTNYKNVLYAYRFEMFTSITVTSLFLTLYKTSRILKIRNKELEHALIKSQESDSLKTDFINNINHEIRTPLNGIIGFTNLIVDPDLDNERRIEYNEGLVSSSNRLLSIISNIIDISKIKTGQVKLIKESVSINELLDEIYLQYSSLAKEKNLLFKIDRNDMGSDDIIVTDRNSLRQILEHLLNNAFKFTQKGSVSVNYIKKEDHVTFSVKDTGPGIESSLQDKIFEYFSKIENQNEKFYPGTGLGLSISKILVTLLGGEIYVESYPGKGSTFTFSIPAFPELKIIK
jgi:signal transduction histidine kinase